MSDRIFVTGLCLHAYHGVMQHEAEVGQTFLLDLDVDVDLSEAAQSDKVSDTVSYDLLVEVASKAFQAQRFRLIEAAAGAVADALLAHYPRIDRICVTVHKPHAPIAAAFADVGVKLSRSRHG